MLKGFKPINFESKSIFVALFTAIFLYILQVISIATVGMLLGSNFVSYILANTILIVLIFLINRKSIIKQFKDIKKDGKGKVKNIILFTIIFLLGEFFVNLLLIKILGHQPPNNAQIFDYINNDNMALFIFHSLITAPIFEALMFFYPYRKVENRKVAIVVSILFFSLLHITTSNNLLDLLFTIPYILMSCALCYGYYKTDNIFYGIFAHIFSNMLAIINILVIFYG